MSKSKLDDGYKNIALSIIGADMMYELRCEHCGRFLGYYTLNSHGNGVLLYCKACKGWTIKSVPRLENVD